MIAWLPLRAHLKGVEEVGRGLVSDNRNFMRGKTHIGRTRI